MNHPSINAVWRHREVCFSLMQRERDPNEQERGLLNARRICVAVYRMAIVVVITVYMETM